MRRRFRPRRDLRQLHLHVARRRGWWPYLRCLWEGR
jgi:hypothetical protein